MAKKKSKSKNNKPKDRAEKKTLKATAKKKRGPKSKYDEKIHPQLCKWMARGGLTEAQIAAELGISYKQFKIWKSKYEEIGAALKENKNFTDSLVEDSLLKRALGFEYDEVEKKEIILGNGESAMPATEIKRTTKLCVPDVKAGALWLSNRQGGKWRNKTETELTGKNGGPIEVKNTDIDLTGLTDEEIKKLEEIASRVKPGNSGDDSSGKG